MLPRPLLVRVQPPQYFLFNAIVIYVVETIAELLVLAMAMFLAAFFCMRVLFIPQNANKAIEKIYEVEEAIHQER